MIKRSPARKHRPRRKAKTAAAAAAKPQPEPLNPNGPLGRLRLCSPSFCQDYVADLEQKLTGLRLHYEEQQKALAALRERHRELKSLFETAPVGYVILDEQAKIVETNRRFAALVGLGPKDLAGMSFVSFLAPGQLSVFLAHLRLCREKRTRTTAEVLLRDGHKGLTPVELVSVPQPTPLPQSVSAIRTAVLDIILRRHAEAELATTQRDYRALINAIDGIVYEADGRHLDISYVSDAAERVLGWSLQEWQRPNFWKSHLHVEDRERVLNELSRALAARTDLVLEYRMLRPDRQAVWLHDNIAVRFDEKGQPKLLGVAVDITPRKEMEDELRRYQGELEARVQARTAELRESVAELEAFSYSLSHDMRAPLRAVNGYLQILLDDAAERLSDQHKDYIQRMLESTRRLDLLLIDVLKYSRLSRTAIELRPVDVTRLVEQLIREHDTLQPPHAKVEVQKPLKSVLAHDAFLTQALSNLLWNAVKFVGPGKHPHVRLWTERVNGQVRVWVADNGIGIPAEQRQRIFGMFQRLHTEKEYPGTGIGLAIVHKAVQRMGGSVGVESEPGAGSRFWIQLPAA